MICVPEAGLFPRIPRPVSFLEAAQYFLGEAFRVCRQWIFEHEAHHLPVSREGGLGRGALDHQAVGGDGRLGWRDAFDLTDVAQAQGLQVRGFQAAHRLRRVAERVGAFVPESAASGAWPAPSPSRTIIVARRPTLPPYPIKMQPIPHSTCIRLPPSGPRIFPRERILAAPNASGHRGRTGSLPGHLG